MRLEDRIACTALPVPTPDLKVPPPATARCGPIRICEGGSFMKDLPPFPRQSECPYVFEFSLLMIHGNLIFEPVRVFTFSSFASAFLRDLNEMNFSFKSLFAIWLLSPQRFLGQYYFYLSIVS